MIEKGTPKKPVYRKIPRAGSRARPIYFVVCDEGCRQTVVCDGMYECTADWLIETIQGKPFAPGRRP